MSDDLDNPPPSFSAARKFGTGFGVLVGVTALIAIIVMVNFLGARHYRRVTLSEDRVPPLSPVSLQVLGMLTNELKVTVFFDPDEVLYSHILQLLRQYEHASPRVKISVVNYLTEPARAEKVKTASRLATGARDLVIFELGGNQRIVRQGELSEYDTGKLLAGKSQSVKRKSFTGEAYFTSAILTLIESRRPHAYFLSGHNEHDPQTAGSSTGYGKLTMLLQANGIATSMLPLVGTNQIPADCSILIVAGPTLPVSANEQEKLNRYLNQGGRVLMLLRAAANPALEPLLLLWGVSAGDDVVTDPNAQRDESHIALRNFGDHEIMRTFGITQNGLILAAPRSLTPRPPGQGSDAPQVRALVSTTESGAAVKDYRNGLRFDPRTDARGIIPVAVAVERGGLKSVEGGSTRMVVVGDSIFLGNDMIDKSINRDFAHNAVNWLVDRPRLIGIAPRLLHDHSFIMSDSQMRSVQWILLAGVPGAILAFGLLVWFRRQS